MKNRHKTLWVTDTEAKVFEVMADGTTVLKLVKDGYAKTFYLIFYSQR